MGPAKGQAKYDFIFARALNAMFSCLLSGCFS